VETLGSSGIIWTCLLLSGNKNVALIRDSDAVGLGGMAQDTRTQEFWLFHEGGLVVGAGKPRKPR